MTNLLSAIDRIAFRIGSVEVAWYGILIVLGMLTGLLIVLSQVKRINLNFDDAIEFFLWVIPLAVVMARLLYVMVRPEEYFNSADWKENSTDAFVHMIAIWDGGITIIGGILGGLVGVILFWIRKRKKANFGQIVDLVVPALLVGQLFGRVGNFINQEAFGKPASMLGIPEKFPFSVYIDNPSGVEPEYHDLVYSNTPGWFAATFFYEMCWNAIGAVIAFVVWRKNKRYPGILAFFYFFWYFLGRGLLEYVRIDAVPVTQIACFVVVPVAVVLAGAFILACENHMAFKKINNAMKDGIFGDVYFSNWEVKNYLVSVKIIEKCGKVARKFYGIDDTFTVAPVHFAPSNCPKRGLEVPVKKVEVEDTTPENFQSPLEK
ncbi:MAG: prolipoprotein diacylglyceryl transferase [Clostridia bacterium]|nr:prolipoprotein diacylglyceryl transferase [Clostridia bacterium]